MGVSRHENTQTGNSPGSPLHWLPVEDLDRAAGSRVDLIVHHVLQTLIIRWTDEDLRGQLPTGEPVVQDLSADQ